MRRLAILVAMVPLALGGCVQEVKQDRVKAALMAHGLSEQMSDCMSYRMSQKLSIAQLHHLQELEVRSGSWLGYVDAVRRVNDPDALEVLLSSAVMCRTGLIH